jgi:hypothetical protein
MRKLTVITALLAVVVALPAVAPAKNNPGVMRTGVCSGLGASWKLKAKHDDGRIEVEYEVDQNRVGDTWRVRIRHDDDLVFAGTRTTKAPSGSFEVEILQRNRAGDDVFRGRAVNLRTGEVCGGRAVWTA